MSSVVRCYTEPGTASSARTGTDDALWHRAPSYSCTGYEHRKVGAKKRLDGSFVPDFAFLRWTPPARGTAPRPARCSSSRPRSARSAAVSEHEFPSAFGGASPVPSSRSHEAERARPQRRAGPTTARAHPCGACAAPPRYPGMAERKGLFSSPGGASCCGPIECVHRTKLPNRSAGGYLKATARREAAVGGLSRGRGVFV